MAADEPRRERKIVTVFFADLVGFTSRAEGMDPEDVADELGRYHARLRFELERFGGTVEKFIGDAVMALYGAPVAHEDDPERAVRAALSIRDWIRDEGGELQVRIAVNTGEALVNLGARPGEGEGMAAGDVVNTAARIQTAAPSNGILVGEQTFRATRQTIEYRETEPIDAKGKIAPISVWEAVEARSRFGIDVEQGTRVPLVGRGQELDLLLRAFGRVRSEREPQLVTLVGAPGIGKSRLVWELFEQGIEPDPDLIYWRQGRCLPYGDGVTYWAVGEMVKAQAGILDTDAAEQAEAKLAAAAEVALGDDAGWIVPHIRPLVGLAEQEVSGGERRVEAFTAWRRFFEALAEQRPLVLVFEDLHWADDGLLDFVDHLVDWAGGVPLLVICTTRPELLDRRSDWGGGKLNATTVALSPLADEDAARLVAGLIGRAVLPAETQTALLARAGGNPLYAEQYARLFLESGSDSDLPLPVTVQGIIAARLDGLAPPEKAALHDAAVIGKVFWPGALVALGGHGDLDGLLHGLERKDFVRRERRTTVGDETEYAFRHALVRDVAYGQIPRAERAERHRRAAEWIESLSERAEDVAEMLAHHYGSALQLMRAAGQETEELRNRARRALRRAGERAETLSALDAAAHFYAEALELWPAADPERPALELALVRALTLTDEVPEELAVAARDGLLAQGEVALAADAESRLAQLYWNRGEGERAREHMARSRELAEQAPPSTTKAWVLAQLGHYALAHGDFGAALSLAQTVVELADSFRLEDLAADTLITLGTARFGDGNEEGLVELERGLALGERLNAARIMIRGYKNFGDALQRNGELARTVELHAQGLETARRFGDRFHVRWFSSELALDDYLLGRWDEALAGAEEFLAAVEGGSPHYMEAQARYVRGLIRLARGDAVGVGEDSERLLELTRASGDRQQLVPGLALRARVLCASGDATAARLLVAEAAAVVGEPAPVPSVAEVAVAAVAVGYDEPLARAVGTRWARAAAALTSGDFASAAALYAEMGSVPDEAAARLAAARSLIEQGRRGEADGELQAALAIYRRLGAPAYVREAETLLAATA